MLNENNAPGMFSKKGTFDVVEETKASMHLIRFSEEIGVTIDSDQQCLCNPTLIKS